MRRRIRRKACGEWVEVPTPQGLLRKGVLPWCLYQESPSPAYIVYGKVGYVPYLAFPVGGGWHTAPLPDAEWCDLAQTYLGKKIRAGELMSPPPGREV